MSRLEQLDLFHGQISPQMANLYARLPREDNEPRLVLGGKIVGPHSPVADTLPATFHLRDLGQGHTILAGCRITDPCFWSPRAPSQYVAHVELRDGDRVVESQQRWIGMRWFGAENKNLRLDGKRWVLRGVYGQSPEDIDWDWCRESSTVIVTDNATERVCGAATEAGVLLAVRVSGADGEVRKQLRRLSRWPAVAIAAVGADETIDETIRQTAPNILLAQWLDPIASGSLAGWAQAAFCPLTDAAGFNDVAATIPVPVVAIRREQGTVRQLRSACDRLQRDLAPGGEHAGFVV